MANYIPDYTLKVIETKLETHDTKSIKLDIKGIDIQYKSGQYLIMTFPELVDQEKSNLRAFTISSSPTERDFIMVTTKLTGSKFKEKLNHLKIGDKINVKLPFGRFTLDEDYSSHIVMIAGGIGITPFRSHIKYATDKNLPLKITLLYSNKAPEEIIFYSEFEQLMKFNLHLKVIHTITRPEESKQKWGGKIGRIDEKIIKEFATDFGNTLFYTCGPPAMVDGVIALLKEMNAKPENIKIEKFVGY